MSLPQLVDVSHQADPPFTKKDEEVTDSFELCKRLLLEKRVGIAPGVAFGAGGEGSVRLCYAADRSVLEPALARLSEFLTGRR